MDPNGRDGTPALRDPARTSEALTAVAFLTQAIESEAAGLEILTAVADYLRRAANEPELHFQAPEPT